MDIIYYVGLLSACFVGMLLGGIVIPRIFLVAFRCRLFDSVDSRKVHTELVPRLGGISFFPCIAVSVSLGAIIHYFLVGYSVFDTYSGTTRLFSLFTGLLVVYLMGMMDDLIGMRYRSKFLIQLFCGILLVAAGCYFDNLYGLFGISEMPLWISMPLSVFIYVYTMNAFNFIDGIDGLAAGLSIIALIALGVMFAAMQWWVHALITCSAIGVLTSFFYFNVIGKSSRKRKIFMGDTGSLTIGLLLPTLIFRLGVENAAKDALFPHAFFIAFSFLIVPLFDVVRVVFHRLRKGCSPFLPDRNHIHHKFIILGFSQRKVLAYILAIDLAFALFNVLCIRVIPATPLLLLDILIWTLMNVILTKQMEAVSKKQ